MPRALPLVPCHLSAPGELRRAQPCPCHQQDRTGGPQERGRAEEEDGCVLGRGRGRSGCGEQGEDEDRAGFTTLLGLKTECTQRSISLVSSPWGSPQTTTCPETAQMAQVRSRRALVAPQRSLTEEGGSAAPALPV